METNNLILPEELTAVEKERRYSIEQWGPSDEFDDKNTLNDWVTYICMYACDSARMTRRQYPNEIYDQLIKSANLALLAAQHVRTGDRGLRHYDFTYQIGKERLLGKPERKEGFFGAHDSLPFPERDEEITPLFDTLEGADAPTLGKELTLSDSPTIGGQANRKTTPETEINIRRGGDGIPL